MSFGRRAGVGRHGPRERFEVGIGADEVVVDPGFKVSNAVEALAPDAFARDLNDERITEPSILQFAHL